MGSIVVKTNNESTHTIDSKVTFDIPFSAEPVSYTKQKMNLEIINEARTYSE